MKRKNYAMTEVNNLSAGRYLSINILFKKLNGRRAKRLDYHGLIIKRAAA